MLQTNLHIEIDDEKYLKAVNGGLDNVASLPDAGDVAMHIKVLGTQNKKSALVVSHLVKQQGGQIARAQTSMTLRAFLLAAKILQAQVDIGVLFV